MGATLATGARVRENLSREDKGDSQPAPSKKLFDPYQPLPVGAGKEQQTKGGTRHNQTARRARILAATRRLLGERGCEEVTVREIARTAGFALQTVYNLVGPRDQVITEAISLVCAQIELSPRRLSGNDATRNDANSTWESSHISCAAGSQSASSQPERMHRDAWCI
jgi:hypothetical protein